MILQYLNFLWLTDLTNFFFNLGPPPFLLNGSRTVSVKFLKFFEKYVNNWKDF